MAEVMLVAVGGATCSGKTTLAKHLSQILPGSVIIHQDDFLLAQHLIPVHPIHNVQDWDAAPTAILWPQLVGFLQQIKKTGVVPPDHSSHDHLNDQTLVPIGEDLRRRWIQAFNEMARVKGNNVKWVLIDGFLLYWHPGVIDELDVRFFLRAPEDVLKKRRHERHGYHTTVQTDPEGALWRDPPGYWENIVYPAYLDAHRDVFVDGNVDNGRPGPKVPDLIVLDTPKMDMASLVDRCCQVLRDAWEKK